MKVGTIYVISLIVTCILSVHATIWAVELQEGWPVVLGEGIHSSPALADLDGDGCLETIFAGLYIGNLYVVEHNGSYFKGWPPLLVRRI